MKEHKLLAIDFETSDLLENDGQPINFGAVLIDEDKLEIIDEFEVFIHLEGGRKISPEAFRVHGISEEKLRKVGFAKIEAKKMFLNWLNKHNIVVPWKESLIKTNRAQLTALGHNIGMFDIPIIKKFLGHPYREVFSYTHIDTLQLVQYLNRVSMKAWDAPIYTDSDGKISHKLENCIKITKFHDALSDAIGSFNLYKKCMEFGVELFKDHEASTEQKNYSENVKFCPDCRSVMQLDESVSMWKCVVCGGSLNEK